MYAPIYTAHISDDLTGTGDVWSIDVVEDRAGRKAMIDADWTTVADWMDDNPDARITAVTVQAYAHTDHVAVMFWSDEESIGQEEAPVKGVNRGVTEHGSTDSIDYDALNAWFARFGWTCGRPMWVSAGIVNIDMEGVS